MRRHPFGCQSGVYHYLHGIQYLWYNQGSDENTCSTGKPGWGQHCTTRSSPGLSLQIKQMSVLHQTSINNFAASAKHFLSMFLTNRVFECQHSPSDEKIV